MTYVGLDDDSDVVKRERLVGISLLISIIIFTAVDIFEDYHEGSSLAHMLSEITVVLVCAFSCIYLWKRVIHVWDRKATAMHNQLVIARNDAKKWKEETALLTRGLSAAIEKQLESWNLSSAEKEVSFALIKGLSFKEIAEIRNTSEHTVRQQAATIYKKSDLEGRAQLSAFFLEDLLTISPKDL